MLKEITVPDIGEYKDVEVIEVSVQVGDIVQKEDSLITIETDKATMDIPAPEAGEVKKLQVAVGSKVSEGSIILELDTQEGGNSDKKEVKEVKEVKDDKKEEDITNKNKNKNKDIRNKDIKNKDIKKLKTNSNIHASPSVRRIAREFGIDLSKVSATGPKERILIQDIKDYVKKILSAPGAGANLEIAPLPEIDFAKFGEIKIQSLSRIQKLSGSFLHRNWVQIPHVTQFDEADITELEEFRKGQKALAEKNGIKLTPLVFMMKAVVAGLKKFKQFNSSLKTNSKELVLKNYFHIGVAVDTPNGLVVPVIKDVDQKGLFKLALELGEISKKARDGKLTASDMSGGCFTISSLGGIGGTAFTPIVNAPEVAILGVCKAKWQPILVDGEFKPKLMVPLSLSYDHRVIDGAEAVRFTSFLVSQLADIRRLLL